MVRKMGFLSYLVHLFSPKVSYCEVNKFTDDFRVIVEPDLCDVEKGLR